jgi:hypothetical protein
MSGEFYALVRLNLMNFSDPYYNTNPFDRVQVSRHLAALIQAGEVDSDGCGGWKLTPKGRENTTLKDARKYTLKSD